VLCCKVSLIKSSTNIVDAQQLYVLYNIAYKTNGHCFMLTDGSERNNIITGNLAIDAQGVADEGPYQISPTESSPAMFLFTNLNNQLSSNVAVK
jgi:hypothetical protein